MNRKTLALLVSLLCVAARAWPSLAWAATTRAPPAPLQRARPAASAPIEIALKPEHHSGVTGNGQARSRTART